MATATDSRPRSPAPAAPSRFQARRAFRLLREVIRNPERHRQGVRVLRSGRRRRRRAPLRSASSPSPRAGGCSPRARSSWRSWPTRRYLAVAAGGEPRRLGTCASCARAASLRPGCSRRASAAPGSASEDDAEHEWFYDRINVMHDLWHVLTGYGTDELGEAALIAFSSGADPEPRASRSCSLAAVVTWGRRAGTSPGRATCGAPIAAAAARSSSPPRRARSCCRCPCPRCARSSASSRRGAVARGRASAPAR